MKTLNRIFAVSFLAVFLAVAGYAQQQGSQSLTTTTLGAAITTGIGTATSSVNLASISNVYATVSVQTTIWVDTEAMDVVTNSVPTVGTTVLVTRGTHGTKAELHNSGATVYVGRPNLYQGYDVAGGCGSGTTQQYLVLPWINLTDGKLFTCRSDNNWFNERIGSGTSAAHTAPASFCTGVVGSAQTEYLNDAACSGATTSTKKYVVSTAGEVTNLNVASSAAVVGGSGLDVVTVYKNGTATALTCTIAAAGTTCTDATHGFQTVVGDLLTFQFVSATSDTAANVSATVGIYGN